MLRLVRRTYSLPSYFCHGGETIESDSEKISQKLRNLERLLWWWHLTSRKVGIRGLKWPKVLSSQTDWGWLKNSIVRMWCRWKCGLYFGRDERNGCHHNIRRDDRYCCDQRGYWNWRILHDTDRKDWRLFNGLMLSNNQTRHEMRLNHYVLR